MIEQSRHVPLRAEPWDQTRVTQTIDEIVGDAVDQFGDDQLWPVHPLHDGAQHGRNSIYFGAAGVIWALEHLKRHGAIQARFDFRRHLPKLLDRTTRDMANYKERATTGSLLFGDMGTALMIMRLAPSTTIADLVHKRAEANTRLPIRELLAWLAATLSAEPDVPTLILMHHPPFLTGIAHMDRIGLAGREEFAAIVARHPQIQAILCGHVHRAIHARVAGRAAMICPSPAHQVALDLTTDGPSAFRLEPPGYMLHRWHGDQLVSHVAVLGDWPGPFPFFDASGYLID